MSFEIFYCAFYGRLKYRNCSMEIKNKTHTLCENIFIFIRFIFTKNIVSYKMTHKIRDIPTPRDLETINFIVKSMYSERDLRYTHTHKHTHMTHNILLQFYIYSHELVLVFYFIRLTSAICS